jgi:hypothetical protein
MPHEIRTKRKALQKTHLDFAFAPPPCLPSATKRSAAALMRLGPWLCPTASRPMVLMSSTDAASPQPKLTNDIAPLHASHTRNPESKWSGFSHGWSGF